MARTPVPDELAGHPEGFETLLLKKVAPTLKNNGEISRIEKAVNDVITGIREKIREKDQLFQLINALEEVDALAASGGNQFYQKYASALQSVLEMLRKCGMQELYNFGLDPAFQGHYSKGAADTFQHWAAMKNEKLHVFPSHLHAVKPGAVMNPELLFLALKLLKYDSVNPEKHQKKDEIRGLTLDLTDIFVRFIILSYETKKTAYETQTLQAKQGTLPRTTRRVPLDLNTEKTLMELFMRYSFHPEAAEILKAICTELKSKDEAREVDVSEWVQDFSETLTDLEAQGLYRKVLSERGLHPEEDLSEEASLALRNAKIKVASIVDFDDRGMPYSNDPSPQFPWADLNAYRKRLHPPYNTACNAPDPKDIDPISLQYRRELRDMHGKLCVATQLQIMKRASVAELLRKLVNKDINWGESQDIKSTRVGHYMGDMENPCLRNQDDPFESTPRPYHPEKCRTVGDDLRGTALPYIPAFCQELQNDFETTGLPAKTLFEPLNTMLRQEMETFGAILKQRFGKKYKLLRPRVKSPESTLLKGLKESKSAVGEVTDLIGFTILTETEEETVEVYTEIEAMMDPEKGIKPHDMWEKESSRGRRSMDITGVPRGRQIRIQVQCRPRMFEEVLPGRLANHNAYKVISGEKLLDEINKNPDQYLDLLYQLIHNLNYAYHAISGKKPSTPERIMEIYSQDHREGFTIVRTSKLY